MNSLLPSLPPPSGDGRPHWDSRAVDAPSKTPVEIGLRKWLESEVRDGRVQPFRNQMNQKWGSPRIVTMGAITVEEVCLL